MLGILTDFYNKLVMVTIKNTLQSVSKWAHSSTQKADVLTYKDLKVLKTRYTFDYQDIRLAVGMVYFD